jgi:hypothetical protein
VERQDEIEAVQVVQPQPQILPLYLELGLVVLGEDLLSPLPLGQLLGGPQRESPNILRRYLPVVVGVQHPFQDGLSRLHLGDGRRAVHTLGDQGVDFLGVGEVRQLRVVMVDIGPPGRPRGMTPSGRQAF